MRLVTHGDLDGLTASVLITEMEQIDEIQLVHPQDITDKKVVITSDDILANLPYDPRAGMWFDHHAHTVMPEGSYKGAYEVAPSVARVIYNYYAADKLKRFDHLVKETDRFDSADLTMEDVVNPQEVILLGFLVDPRTGMGGDFRTQFTSLVERLRSRDLSEILNDPDIREQTAIFRRDDQSFHEFLLAHSKVHGKVVVTDYRDVENPPAGNRFLVYTTFPDCNVSLRIQWGPGRKLVALNLGHSIFDRSCTVDVGEFCRKYGGGGHRGAGGCVLRPMAADLAIRIITEKLKKN
ncbi:MAG: exopolyphosphatase [Deltaproteobacteria bacterium]|nr:exopolyphosphatase [Deltaproteobacteria bacterium]